MITLKPWEFPLATAESRAAARAMIATLNQHTPKHS